MSSIKGFATGGFITGAGTGTSDSILARVSNGESIINASATKKYAPMIAAMNAGADILPGSASGGGVQIVQNLNVSGTGDKVLEARLAQVAFESAQMAYNQMYKDAKDYGPITQQIRGNKR
jgi:hypothetical protein